MDGSLNTLLQFGALGLLAWLLWTLSRFLPGLVRGVLALQLEIQALRYDLAEVTGRPPSARAQPPGKGVEI